MTFVLLIILIVALCMVIPAFLFVLLKALFLSILFVLIVLAIGALISGR